MSVDYGAESGKGDGGGGAALRGDGRVVQRVHVELLLSVGSLGSGDKEHVLKAHIKIAMIDDQKSRKDLPGLPPRCIDNGGNLMAI